MKEKRAGILLCEYYNSDFNKWGDFLNKTGDFSRHFSSLRIWLFHWIVLF
jgi:hypothetical protein